MQFVVIARHSPELCPTANATIRELLKAGAQQIPNVAQKLGITIISINVCGPEHQIIALIESPDIERVQSFIVETRLIQWSTITIHASWSLEEVIAKADTLPPIF